MSSSRETVPAAIHARIAKLCASLRYSHGQDRSDTLASIATCEQLLAEFEARLTLH